MRMNGNKNDIVLEGMNKKKRLLYSCLWGSKDFDFPVEKTICRGKVTPNSYKFTNTSSVDEDICGNRLAEIFGITNVGLFREKFSQSIGGNGQELKRIATIHSSSLCALLFFYNVTENNPYIMEIEGEEYIFTYSCFEYQNTVIEGRNPSNMDVVLIGRNCKSEMPAVMFLESKFSEYYERVGRQLKIAVEYLDNFYGKELYGREYLSKMNLNIIMKSGEPNFVLCSEEPCYLEGIKQMISHYIGIRNLCVESASRTGKVANKISAGAKIFLGEILFTKGIGNLQIRSGEGCFLSYQKKYSVLSNCLNEQLVRDKMDDKITVLNDIMSYTQFHDKSFIKESEIKKFYFALGEQ